MGRLIMQSDAILDTFGGTLRNVGCWLSWTIRNISISISISNDNYNRVAAARDIYVAVVHSHPDF